METRRFFIEDLNKDSTDIMIEGDELHHLRNVLRLTEGVQVVLFNGKGLLADAVIERIDRCAAYAAVKETEEILREGPAVTLIMGLLKGDQTETVIERATELGATSIIIYTSERTVPKPKQEKAKARLKKWRSKAIGAAKQSGRAWLPEITGPMELEEAVGAVSSPIKLALWEEEESSSLGELLRGYDKSGSVALLVGPEGGLSLKDMEKIKARGFKSAGLGREKLRAGTAATAGLSIVIYEGGGLGGDNLEE